ncbi:MAG: isoamylase early set domain-containing protein [Desulfovibrio sp.]|jgi:1,4-alpha-glucan branching enzyme|nr:isoamylase early set domain-containing protein [Desulfovibrio sp.]
MSITKNFLKTRASCKVRFSLSAQEAFDAEGVFLAGDFNDWNLASHPMKRVKGNGFNLEIELPLGIDYRFRYLTDTGTWFNDPEADAYVVCVFTGEENFLVKL